MKQVLRRGLIAIVLLHGCATPQPHGIRATPSAAGQGFVMIDRSQAAYWVVARFADDARESVKSKTQSAPVEIVDWSAFKSDPERYIGSVIVKDEYPGSNVLKGIVALLDKYAQTPFGLTWTGGLAITRNDYLHTERIYQRFRDSPDAHERTRVSSDRARDPIHPANHLDPLLGQKPAVDRSPLIVTLMAIETIQIQKQVCDARFPAYSQQNEAAYQKSPYARVTSEQMVEHYGDPSQRDGILRGLERDRTLTTTHFQQMDSGRLERMCADVPQAIEKLRPR